MKSDNENKIIYDYDGNVPLTKDNWKCANCNNYITSSTSCYIKYSQDNEQILMFPNKHLELTDECEGFDDEFIEENINNLHYAEGPVFESSETEIIVKQYANNKLYTATVEIQPDWNTTLYNLATQKALVELQKQINNDMEENNLMEVTQENTVISDTDDQQYQKFEEKFINSGANLYDKLVKAFDEGTNFSINETVPDLIDISFERDGKKFTTTLQLEPSWDKETKEIAIEKATKELEEFVRNAYKKNEKTEVPQQIKKTEKHENPSHILKDKKTIEESKTIGWICPRCGKVNAPWVRQCNC